MVFGTFYLGGGGTFVAQPAVLIPSLPFVVISTNFRCFTFLLVLKGKSEVGIIVDKMKDCVVVNGVVLFFHRFLSFLCDIACFDLRDVRNDVIIDDIISHTSLSIGQDEHVGYNLEHFRSSCV